MPKLPDVMEEFGLGDGRERIKGMLPAETREDVDLSLGQLPDAVRVEIVRELAAPVPAVEDVTPALVEAFADTEVGAILITEWGRDAPRKLAVAGLRWVRVRDRLDENGRVWLSWLVDHSLQPAEVAAVLDVLAA